MNPVRAFLLFFAASLALLWETLSQLLSLSLEDARYSHLVLIPAITAYFLYQERHKIFGKALFSPKSGLLPLAGSLCLYGLLRQQALAPAAVYRLPSLVLAVWLIWISGFLLCCGARSLHAARFPFLMLLLFVPVPANWMDTVIALLQQGSADVSYFFFQLLGTPMFRNGVQFELPGISIRIAAECSSIHSSWALFIVGLILAHMLLRSPWGKLCLCALTLPLAMFTNAIRIVTIWLLSTHVDPGFLYGNLHRNGGILFSLISLSILAGFLWVLRGLERRGQCAA